MGKKKKKSFIDKKKAETYHLVRRSQRDVGGYFDEETGEPLDIPREFVLLPSSTNKRQGNQQQQIHDSYVPNFSTTNSSVCKTACDDPLSQARQQLSEAGLLDEYDYENHMKPITGSGVFIQRGGLESNRNVQSERAINPLENPRSESIPLKQEVMELDRQLDAIDVSADCMDEDIAQALFGDFEEGEFENIMDDFCITADSKKEVVAMDEKKGGKIDDDFVGPTEGDGDGDGDEKRVTSASNPDFDFDKHVQILIEKAKQEERGGEKVALQNHEWWQKQQQEFQSVKPYHLSTLSEDSNNDVDSLDREFNDDGGGLNNELNLTAETREGIAASKLNTEDEEALCDKFEQTLLEYDSDEVGDLDDKYKEIHGDKPLEGDVHIEAVINQFIEAKKDEVFLSGSASTAAGNKKRVGGGSHVLVEGRMVPPNSAKVEEANKNAVDEKVDVVLSQADVFLASPEMSLPPEEVLIDGKSYFSMKERNPWDCESILSTYSNLDNNPAIIGRSSTSRRRRRRNNDASKYTANDVPEEEPQIVLSNRTGLPINGFNNNANDDDDYCYDEQETFVSVNKGVARKKGETKEEKKNRKQAVKKERQIARIQKKMMKEVYKEEFSKQAAYSAADDVAGKSVLRF